MRLALLSLWLTATLCAETVAYIHGRWFDGTRFVERTLYVANGVLLTKPPATIDRTVDLANGYVIPPLADAHSHIPDSVDNRDWGIREYLKRGIFYALNPNDIAARSNPLREQINRPDTFDMIFAHAGFTIATGHPRWLYEGLLKQKVFSGYTPEQLNGAAYYSVDSLAELDRSWPIFLATKPQLVKIYLLFSDEYTRHPGAQPTKSQGLRPEIAAEIIRRAHRAHLRCVAHVETAADARAAIENGIDALVHLPPLFLTGQPPYDFRITPELAALAHRRHVTVVPTTGLAARNQPAALPAVQALQKENLRNLRAAKVPILIGSDTWPGGSYDEVTYLRQLNIFTDLELLRIWSMETPRFIFPKRKFAAFRDGYEGSFLVLDKDPTVNLMDALATLRLRVKQGVTYQPPAETPATRQ